jgi:hypothetical protein
MSAFRWHFLSSLRHTPTPIATAPALPLLEHVRDLEPAEWLRESMATFARSVASFIPAGFESYARIFHPFEFHDGDPDRPTSWREQAAAAGLDVRDPATAEAFANRGAAGEQARIGGVPPALIEPLIEHLRAATTTPEQCFFAVWEGFGGSALPAQLEPKLELPYRAYHVFGGPIEAAGTSFSGVSFHHQSANLWWPADHAWCVATEIDFAWTYVGGARACIQALLADPRLEAVETSASARW